MADGSASLGSAPAPGLSRRAMLTASAAALPLLVTACKGIQALGTPPPPPAAVRALEAAITAEAAVIARYASALKQLTAGAYAAALAVHSDHVAHLAQLFASIAASEATHAEYLRAERRGR